MGGAPVRVKICGITRVEDGVAAARAGADAIGLVFWPRTPRAVTHSRALEIVAALPPFVSIVGLFVDPSVEEVRTTLERVRLDYLQFHGSEPAPLCRAFGRPYLKAINMVDGLDLLESVSPYDDAAGLLLDAAPVDGRPGGTGRTFDWTRLPSSLPRPLVLSGGLDATNVADAIRHVRPAAVDVSSGVEVLDADRRPRAGIKDAQRIRAFIEEVRHAAC